MQDSATAIVTVGRFGEKTIEIHCENCSKQFEVPLKGLGSARGPAEEKARLEEEAARAAKENLERLFPMKACPDCGWYQDSMQTRMFDHPMQRESRRRFDNERATVNSPFARLCRLAERGLDGEAIDALIEPDLGDVEREVWERLLARFTAKNRRDRTGASATIGERLAHYLVRERRMPAKRAEPVLTALYGASNAKARELTSTLVKARSQAEGALGFVLTGLAILIIGGILALVFGVVIPAIKEARKPKPEPIRMTFPTPIHYRNPKELRRRGMDYPVPVFPMPDQPPRHRRKPQKRPPTDED